MNILYLIIVFIIIIVSMMLHEIMHGLVAYWLGDDTAKIDGRLTLNPLVHLDPVTSIALPVLLYLMGGPVFGGAKPVPVNKYNLKYKEWGMALVALAGPLMNFILALAGFLIGYWTGLMNSDGVGGFIIVEIVMINLGFMIFNLIPLPPLDGSRVLYALAPDGVRNIMDKMESMGTIFIYILILLCGGIFSSIMSWGITGVFRLFYLLIGM